MVEFFIVCILSELPFLCFDLNATQGGYTSLRGLSYMYIRYFIISFVEAVGRKDTVGGASRDIGSRILKLGYCCVYFPLICVVVLSGWLLAWK